MGPTIFVKILGSIFSMLLLINISIWQFVISQERLNGLAMLSIEKDMIKNLDYESLMDDFAEKKCKKIYI